MDNVGIEPTTVHNCESIFGTCEAKIIPLDQLPRHPGLRLKQYMYEVILHVNRDRLFDDAGHILAKKHLSPPELYSALRNHSSPHFLFFQCQVFIYLVCI